MKTIYVASSSAQAEQVAGYLKILVDYGWEVTYDWPADVLADRERPYDDDGLRASAQADLDAVRRADVLWYVTPAAGKSEGSTGELCAALILGKLVVVSGDLSRDRIFPRLAQKYFALHAEALDWLREYVKVEDEGPLHQTRVIAATAIDSNRHQFRWVVDSLRARGHADPEGAVGEEIARIVEHVMAFGGPS